MKELLTLVFIIAGMTAHAQTNYHFSHTVTTNASADKIWAIWTDVGNWNRWDSGLKSSSLEGPFQPGSNGKLVPDKGSKSKFVISELDYGKSYTFKTRIPFGWLIVKRSLQDEDGKTSFTHDVQFTGLLRKPLGNRIGKRYRALLPEVMENIKSLAEQQ